MTTRGPCLAVTVFWCLLAVATSASAECAWVMWQHYISPLESWEINEAHPTVKECSQNTDEAAAQDLLDAARAG